MEWWYFSGWTEGKFFHHTLFKNTIGREQRLYLHCSLNGIFQDFDEDEIQHHGYYTKFSGNKFDIRNSFFTLSLYPISNIIIHMDTEKWGYYSIPHLKGDNSNSWMDHEYFNLFRTSGSLRKKLKNLDFTWDWTGIRYLDGSIGIRADKKYSIISFPAVKGELHPLSDEVIFSPKFGLRYSEQPLEAILDGEVIGYGVRERTYQRRA